MENGRIGNEILKMRFFFCAFPIAVFFFYFFYSKRSQFQGHGTGKFLFFFIEK
jgi:hypothetical protein